MIRDGLWDSFSNTHMGNLAEYTAKKAGVSRKEQDEFALQEPSEGREGDGVVLLQGRDRFRSTKSRKTRDRGRTRHSRSSRRSSRRSRRTAP